LIEKEGRMGLAIKVIIIVILLLGLAAVLLNA
jgi:hypothetical protein